MRKTAKIFISLLLLFAIACSFASCDLIKRFGDKDGPGTTYKEAHVAIWVETYDELKFVLDRMKAAGTKTLQIPAFDCEEYGIDVKFQIVLRRSEAEQLQDGENYYDVKLNFVHIVCYLFFEEVTIEQIQARYSIIEGSKCSEFRFYRVAMKNRYDVLTPPKDYEDFKIHNVGLNGETNSEIYYMYYDGKNQFYIERSRTYFDLTEEQLETLEKTVVLIE